MCFFLCGRADMMGWEIHGIIGRRAGIWRALGATGKVVWRRRWAACFPSLGAATAFGGVHLAFVSGKAAGQLASEERLLGRLGSSSFATDSWFCSDRVPLKTASTLVHFASFACLFSRLSGVAAVSQCCLIFVSAHRGNHHRDRPLLPHSRPETYPRVSCIRPCARVHMLALRSRIVTK